MKQYRKYLKSILTLGYEVPPARENMPSVTFIPTYQMNFHFRNGLPILTGKQMPFYSILGELICFIQGKTDVRDFDRMGCSVWWENAYKWNIVNKDLYISLTDYKAFGMKAFEQSNSKTVFHVGVNKIISYDLGRIYSAQWRDYVSAMSEEPKHTDQLSNMIKGMNNTPYSRYHVMDAWNPGELNNTSQPNCHVYFQASIVPRRRLSMINNRYHNFLDEDTSTIVAAKYDDDRLLFTHLTQRSCDAYLGVPFNITSYALLTIILGILTKSRPMEFSWVGVNNHIYENHHDAVDKYLDEDISDLPRLHIVLDRMDTLQKLEAIDSLQAMKEIFQLVDYNHGPKIPAPLSVGL